MSDKPREPLIGWMIMEDCHDDLSQWDGVISFPDPTGANLAWQNPTKMIEYSAYEAIAKERDYLREFNEPRMKDLRVSFDRVEKERDLAHKTANELRLKNLDLIKELAQARGLLKDHEDDWKRIQDAERALDEALAQSEFSNKHSAHNSQIMNHDSKYANNSAGPTGYTVDARGERIPDSEHPMRSATECKQHDLRLFCKNCGAQ